MGTKRSPLGVVRGLGRLCVSLSLVVSVLAPLRAEEDVDKKYYWEGNRLNNQSRLSDGMGQFEEDIKRARVRKDADQYLAEIRTQSLEARKKAAEASKTLVYNGMPVEQALVTQRTPDGRLRLTLRLNALFEQNTSVLRAGAMDVLDQVVERLRANKMASTEVNLIDQLDDMPDASNASAERALFVTSYLTMTNAPQEDL